MQDGKMGGEEQRKVWVLYSVPQMFWNQSFYIFFDIILHLEIMKEQDKWTKEKINFNNLP